MATSIYFNNFNSSQEQQLIEDLVYESIKIYGFNVKYILRDLQDYDKIYGEDRQTSKYTRAFEVDMYVKNVDGFQGDGDFLSKFNLEIRDQITLTMSTRTFRSEIGPYGGITRPREGDLIYLPFSNVKKCFEIKFVDQEPVFYQLGSLQMYDLRCELFEYNGEYFNTEDAEIDALYVENFLGSPFFFTEAGEFLWTEADEDMFVQGYGDLIETTDSASENETIQNEANEFLDFSETNPFSEGGRF